MTVDYSRISTHLLKVSHAKVKLCLNPVKCQLNTNLFCCNNNFVVIILVFARDQLANQLKNYANNAATAKKMKNNPRETSEPTGNLQTF